MPRDPFAAVISSNRPIGTWLRTEWQATGASLLATDVEPSQTLIVPAIYKNADGRHSVLSIQNTNQGVPGAVTIEDFDSRSPTPIKSGSIAIAAGTSVSLDTMSAGLFDSLPDGFDGWMRLNATTAIAATTHNYSSSDAQGVANLAAQPLDAATESLALPLLSSRWGDAAHSSSIRLLNPGPQAIEVVLTITGIAGNCAGRRDVVGPITIGPAGLQRIGQSASGSTGGLPGGCVASGRLDGTGPLLAAVEVEDQAGSTKGAYLAGAWEVDATAIVLPMVRKRHTSFSMSTEVFVQNLGGSSQTIRLELLKLVDPREHPIPIACETECQALVPAGGTARWDFAELGAFPDSGGSARSPQRRDREHRSLCHLDPNELADDR